MAACKRPAVTANSKASMIKFAKAAVAANCNGSIYDIPRPDAGFPKHGQNGCTITGTGVEDEEIEVDLSEVYFLIMHFLSGGPCQRATGQLWNELLQHKLLPRRYHAWYSRTGLTSGDEDDDDGSSLPLSYIQVVERHPGIEKNHLVKLLRQQLITARRLATDGHLQFQRIPTAADTPTVLGHGQFSLLEDELSKENEEGSWQLHHLRWPHWGADQVHGLALREIGGGFAKHHRSSAIGAANHAILKPSVLVDRIEIIKKLRGHRNAVYCAIFDRSGQYVITGSDDRLVKIWSMETGLCLCSCRGHEGDITTLAVSSDNMLVASASNDYSIHVWHLPDGFPVSVLRGHMGGVTDITFSPRQGCEHLLLSSSDDGTCRIWDARDSTINPRIFLPRPDASAMKLNTLIQAGNQILCCAFNADGSIFVTGSSDRFARVWDACKWNEDLTPNRELDILSGHENDVNHVQFSGCAGPMKLMPVESAKDDQNQRYKNSRSGHDSIVTCSRDGSAIIWIPRSKRIYARSNRWVKAYLLRVPSPPMPPQPPRGGGSRQRLLPTPRGVNVIVWSLDNRYVLAAIMDCRICVWNAADGSLVHSLTGHSKMTYVLDVHPFNPRIAMSAGYDGRVILWDIWEGRPIRTYETGDFDLVDGKFSPDGTSIVVSDDVGQIYLLSTGQGESQKNAKYDQFFLGDFRPLVRDAYGNVLDQETQRTPYERNIQDLLCDASMIPYSEPYQSIYQQRRLGALGIDWKPSPVSLAIGAIEDTTYNGLGINFPINNLAQRALQNTISRHVIDDQSPRWVQQPTDLGDTLDWEHHTSRCSDDSGSNYSASEEILSDVDEAVSTSFDEETKDGKDDGLQTFRRDARTQDIHLPCTYRYKRKAEGLIGQCARRELIKSSDEALVDNFDRRHTRSNRTKDIQAELLAENMNLEQQSLRPKRQAAKNALHFFSHIGTNEDCEEDEKRQDSCDEYEHNDESSHCNEAFEKGSCPHEDMVEFERDFQSCKEDKKQDVHVHVPPDYRDEEKDSGCAVEDLGSSQHFQMCPESEKPLQNTIQEKHAHNVFEKDDNSEILLTIEPNVGEFSKRPRSERKLVLKFGKLGAKTTESRSKGISRTGTSLVAELNLPGRGDSEVLAKAPHFQEAMLTEQARYPDPEASFCQKSPDMLSDTGENGSMSHGNREILNLLFSADSQPSNDDMIIQKIKYHRDSSSNSEKSANRNGNCQVDLEHPLCHGSVSRGRRQAGKKHAISCTRKYFNTKESSKFNLRDEMKSGVPGNEKHPEMLRGTHHSYRKQVKNTHPQVPSEKEYYLPIIADAQRHAITQSRLTDSRALLENGDNLVERANASQLVCSGEESEADVKGMDPKTGEDVAMMRESSQDLNCSEGRFLSWNEKHNRKRVQGGIFSICQSQKVEDHTESHSMQLYNAGGHNAHSINRHSVMTDHNTSRRSLRPRAAKRYRYAIDMDESGDNVQALHEEDIMVKAETCPEDTNIDVCHDTHSWSESDGDEESVRQEKQIQRHKRKRLGELHSLVALESAGNTLQSSTDDFACKQRVRPMRSLMSESAWVIKSNPSTERKKAGNARREISEQKQGRKNTQIEMTSKNQTRERRQKGEQHVYSQNTDNDDDGDDVKSNRIQEGSSESAHHKAVDGIHESSFLGRCIGIRASSRVRRNIPTTDTAWRRNWGRHFKCQARMGERGIRTRKSFTWLMLTEVEEGSRYIPQFGDEVIYLRQGHQEFLEYCQSNDPGPWVIYENSIRPVELCRVSKLDYGIFPESGDTYCKMTLEFSDPSSNVFGKAFGLSLPELTDFPDFLVETSRFDTAMQRKWTNRDRCKVWWRSEDGKGGSWWEGRIVSVKPKSSDFPDSPWERFVVQYKGDTSKPQTHSPWELFDSSSPAWDQPCIDDDRKAQLYSAVESSMVISEDACGIRRLRQMACRSDFISRVPLPLTFDVVKSRLEKDYYRSEDAFHFDVHLLASNAEKYYGSGSDLSKKMCRLVEQLLGDSPACESPV